MLMYKGKKSYGDFPEGNISLNIYTCKEKKKKKDHVTFEVQFTSGEEGSQTPHLQYQFLTSHSSASDGTDNFAYFSLLQLCFFNIGLKWH